MGSIETKGGMHHRQGTEGCRGKGPPLPRREHTRREGQDRRCGDAEEDPRDGPRRQSLQSHPGRGALSHQGPFRLPVRSRRVSSGPGGPEKVLDNLDLLVSIDVNYSQTGWFADVILPENTYLERSNIIATQKGAKPGFVMRRQAVPPRYDSKPAWEIFTLIAGRMGAGQYFPYRSIEEIWHYQLEGTGVSIGDFDAKGLVTLAKNPILMDRGA
ncbi:MAG: molybdopterin-dependent oxidoreductase [Desulfobacterales bacterium]|nr:molybdopterin-dependent oxidoreductase [Desulfobacterales bacterium]